MAGDNKSRQELIYLFQTIMKILQNNNLNFILFYGSLLGVLREDNFIDGDDDVDILLDRKDADKLLSIVSSHDNISYRYGVSHNEQYNLFQLYLNNNTHSEDVLSLFGPIDIYYIDIDKQNNIISLPWEDEIYCYNDIYPLKPINIYGYDVFIPNKALQIIERGYGKDWMIPKSKNNSEYEYNYHVHIEKFTNNDVNDINYNNLLFGLICLLLLIIIFIKNKTK